MATVDDELVALSAERAALVEVTAGVVRVGRSLDASVRVLADQHARVVSRFDTLEVDQLERRLSSPATALAGEFAGDDYAPLLGISSTVAARWAELGAVLRSRHPRLLALAGHGTVRIRACEVLAGELAHLEPADVQLIEAEFLSGSAVHGSEASIRKQLRRLLDHHSLAQPGDATDADSRLGLGFNEVPGQPTLTELFVTMPADDAWLLHAAIEDRAHALVAEWAAARPPGDGGYPIRRARVDALVDLALGKVRFVPDVRISVPVARRITAPLKEHVSSIADVDVRGIGRVSSEAIKALGTTLGAHVTVALASAESGVTAWTSATTYRPGLAMRRHVETRDEHCRFPGCMRPAPMCDIDHVTPHAEGGATNPANLQLLCRHHHRAKTHGSWAVAMTPEGTCAWQSPLGHWLRTHPRDATAYRITAAEGMTIAARARAGSSTGRAA